MTKRLRMPSRWLRPVLWLNLVSLLTLSAVPAFAGANDAQAKQLAEQALFEDYLNLNFEAAKTKLILAVDLCRSGCSPSVKANVYRDLGVVYVAGLKQRDDGIAAFIKAIEASPSVQLDPDLANQEITEAFEEAKLLAAEGQSSAPPPVAEAPATESSDGVTHAAPLEQSVNTPLPLYITVDEDELDATVGKVKVFYRGFGMARYKDVQMKDLGDGAWGVELSCKDVGHSPGSLEYYIVVYDDDGDEITRIGDDSSPNKVRIVEVASVPPSPLPGSEAPAQCEMPEGEDSASGGIAFDPDCPPDFPGCGGDTGMDEDEDEDFDSGAPVHWLSISFQQDMLLMSATSDACSSSRPAELDCFYGGGQFRDPALHDDLNGDGIQDPESKAVSGTVASGFAMGTQRILLGYEYGVTDAVLVGGRIGFAFGGGPQLKAPGLEGPAFFPIHAEVRGSYRFLTDGLFRPYVMGAVGGAQVDGKVATKVIERGLQPVGQQPGVCNTPLATNVPGCVSTVDVWRKTGTGFASLGLGSMLAFGDTHGLLLEARGMLLFPAPGTALGLSAGYVVGF